MKRFALLCFLAFWAVSAEAATYYVRTGGSDSHSCGQAQKANDANAKRTIQNAANSCPNPGDTIIVHGGIYNESVQILANRQGTRGSPITIKNAGGETVWVYGGLGITDHLAGGGTTPNRYWTIDGINVDARDQRSFPIYSDEAYNIVLKNLEVTGSNGDGGIGIGSDGKDTYHQILNVRVHDNGNGPNSACRNPSHGGGCHGIYLHGNYNIVDGLEAWNQPFGNGLTLYGIPSGPVGTIVRNSKFHHNATGIQYVYARDALIYNNLFYENNDSVGGGSGIFAGGSHGGKVYNNTFYHNHGEGLVVSSDTSNLIVRNNIFYNNGSNINNSSGSTTVSNNLTADPRFVNAGAGDFHLQAGSPAIDTGMTVSEITTDLDKTPRPQGGRFTIGAYEYTDRAPRPLSAPTRPRRSKR